MSATPLAIAFNGRSVWESKVRIVSGLGSLSRLPDELRILGAKKPALVLDEFLATSGLAQQWLPKGPDYVECGRARVNPDLEAVAEAIGKAKAAGCDSVVILGGGSALCLGKAVALLLTNPGNVLDYEGRDKLKARPAPTVAIPTTAGSGSEVSKALVLHEHGRHTEVVIVANGSEPNVAILDGELLRSLPRGPMLTAGLDALSHACESLWVRNRSIMTDALAEKAIRELSRLLPLAMAQTDKPPAERDGCVLQELIEASAVANLACGSTGLGLIHALTSSPNVPMAHGALNGAVLLAIARFNRAGMEPEHVALLDTLPDLFAKLGYAGHFLDGEIDMERAQALVDSAQGHPFRRNNCRESSDDDLFAILRESRAVC